MPIKSTITPKFNDCRSICITKVLKKQKSRRETRHSHASYLTIDINIVFVLKRLGHEKGSTTLDRYSHFFTKDERDMLNTMNNDAKRDG